MKTHTLSEAILAKYTPKPIPKLSKSVYSSKNSKQGATLKDLYAELNTKRESAIQNYQSKNAAELESMMVQNRRLIEAQRKPKR